MVVEDHWVWASAVAKHLDDAEEIEVVGVASTADEAIAMAARVRPDVALVDLLLGDDSGVRVARVLHTRAPATRVVIITTEPTVWASREAREVGVAGFVAKDDLLTHEQLVSIVVAVAAGRDVFPRPLDEMGGNESGVLPYGLTGQEREIIRCMSEGMGTPAIALHLCVGRQTVRNKTTAIGRKLGVSGRLEIVARSLAEGIITPPRRA